MTFMLDTDSCSFLMKRSSNALMRRVQDFAPRELKISAITRYELEYGVRRRAAASRLRRLLHAFLLNVDVLPFGEPAACHAGSIRAQLARDGELIGAHDLLIAGHARAAQATLVTHNVREFARVPDLAVVDWATDL